MARVDSSRPSITRSYGPWAKPPPFLPKEFPLLVCSRKVTHSGLLISSKQSERPQGTGIDWRKYFDAWPMTMWCSKNSVSCFKDSVTVNWSRKDSAAVNGKEDDFRTGNRFTCATCQAPGLEIWSVVSISLTFVLLTYCMPSKIVSKYYYFLS